MAEKAARITIIGGGNMGGSFARGLVKNRVVAPSSLRIVEPEERLRNDLREALGVVTQEAVQEDFAEGEVLILAVKPQIATLVCKEFQTHTSESTIVLSLMAGFALDNLAALFPDSALLVRAMPNLPAREGRGLTVFYSQSPGLNAATRVTIHNILGSVGVAIEVASEDLVDAATAVSGSGPAYFYYLVESMVAAAVELGFTPEIAEVIARETFLGAGTLLENSGVDAAELRRQVTSKGGTTAAAIETLDSLKVGAGIEQAVAAAYQRAKELR